LQLSHIGHDRNLLRKIGSKHADHFRRAVDTRYSAALFDEIARDRFAGSAADVQDVR